MGIGVDIVELSRLDVDNERFVRHILADAEYEIFQSFPTERSSVRVYSVHRHLSMPSFYKWLFCLHP